MKRLLAIAWLIVNSSLVLASDLPYKEDELLVRFAPKETGKQRSTSEKTEILNQLGAGTVKHEYKIVPGLTLVKLSQGQTVQDSVKVLNKANGILYAEPDYKIKLLSTYPDDPCFTYLWGLNNIGQPHPHWDGSFVSGTPGADINAPEAWDIKTDSEIIVAVLDSGIDYNHPDLAANIWVNQTEATGVADVDDDGNGYIDDIYGWDFADNDADPIDYQYHGTHVAGIIGAVGDNGTGVTGVCWNIKIMNLKVFPNYGEAGFISNAISAMDYAFDKGAKVLSNSWGGGPYSQSLKNAIEGADANGVLFIAGAGNDGWCNDDTPFYPASYDCNNIISVLSTTHDDDLSYYSNFGPITVDLGAPGEDIYSTFPTYETNDINYYGLSTNYETLTGTSMATPCVSGAAALVWSLRPTFGHLRVKETILNTVDVIPELNDIPYLYRTVLPDGRSA